MAGGNGAAAQKVDAQSMADEAERRQIIDEMTQRKMLPDTSQGNVKPLNTYTLQQLRRYKADMQGRK